MMYSQPFNPKFNESWPSFIMSRRTIGVRHCKSHVAFKGNCFSTKSSGVTGICRIALRICINSCMTRRVGRMLSMNRRNYQRVWLRCSLDAIRLVVVVVVVVVDHVTRSHVQGRSVITFVVCIKLIL